jgi:hypothetical protein
MLYCYSEFALQGRMFRVVSQGVLGLGLIMVHSYYEFACQGRRLMVV